MEKLDFAAFLKTLPQPVFFPCERCGELTNKSPCWECTQKRLRDGTKHERRQALEYTIPDGYERIVLNEQGLYGYVKDARNLGKIVERAYAAVRDEKGRVTLMGQAGAGKTTLAIAMLRAWQELHNQSAIFLRAFDLSGGRFNLDDEWLRAGLIYIDDVGAEQDMKNNLVSALIHGRFGGKPTWVSTGLTRAEIGARYGDGIVRRLFENAFVLDMVAI